ncbi:MAG: hypothetical protein JNK49_19385 [Planctomycetes bacterium]|nr:hypothetical protein [Planctomycetota bacterium]
MYPTKRSLVLPWLLAPLLFAQAAVQPVAPQSKATVPSFAMVVTERFAAWDRDGNGTLSPSEIDALCVDPAVRGAEAAAVAALKRVVRSGKYAVPPLTPDGILNKTRAPAASSGKAEDADRADSTERAPTAALRPVNFPASFASCLRKIQTTPRVLFADETPDLDKCRQGPLGDCYFVAAVGAFVHRDALAVKRLLEPLPDGRFRATFGDGGSIEVSPLTDAEIALSGSTGDEGLWLPVLEKALGQLRRSKDPEKFAMETATDAIANGGSAATIVRMLTGHQTERIALKRVPRSTAKGPDGKPVVSTPQPAGDLEELAARVRREVGAAIEGRRLVTCGTGTEPQPPGISGKHAYAVLGFDATADTLLVWNPHGNGFKPKGEPGLANGYATAAGMFRIPVADFVRVFRSVGIETTRPVDTGKGK